MPAFSRPLLNMMTHVYRIRNWHEHFETYESRKRVKPLDWVPMKTKHDGRGFRRVTRHPHAVNALLGWYMILQVAAKMPIRGLLADLDGPLDAVDLSDKTNLPKRIFQSAFTSLIDDQIGWLEKLPWNSERDFRQNCGDLLWPAGTPAFLLEPAGGTARRSKSQQDQNDNGSLGNVLGDAGEPADRSKPAGQPADASRSQHEPDGYSHIAEHSIAKHVPLPSPKGDSAPEPSADDLIRNAEEAKQIICAKILNGKNAARPWSYDAMNNLARLLPLPRAEVETIARFRAIPKDDAVPELKYRREPITETALMQFWGDEHLRAHTYLQKINGRSEKKKEPEQWRELFRWLSDTPETLHLPDSFWKLGRDQQQEYHQNIAAFQASPEPAHD